MNRIRTALVAIAVGLAAPLFTTGPALAAPNTPTQNETRSTVTVDDATYENFLNVRSGKCLDQNFSGGVNRYTVIAYTCHYGDNQFWHLEHLGNEIYRVHNLQSGGCLQQVYSGSTPTNTVQVLSCNNLSNQRWRSHVWSDGTRTFKNIRSDWFLDQSYSGGVERQTVLAYPFNGGSNQYWI